MLVIMKWKELTKEKRKSLLDRAFEIGEKRGGKLNLIYLLLEIDESLIVYNDDLLEDLKV